MSAQQGTLRVAGGRTEAREKLGDKMGRQKPAHAAGARCRSRMSTSATRLASRRVRSGLISYSFPL